MSLSLEEISKKLAEAINTTRAQNHHIASQKNIIDELVQQNVVFRTQSSILAENNKHGEIEVEKYKKLLEAEKKRADDLQKSLDELKVKISAEPAAPAPAQA